MQAALIVSRWLHYVSVTAAFGLALFSLYAPRTSVAQVKGGGGAFLGFVALALVSGLAWFGFAVEGMADDPGQFMVTLPSVMTDTDFGPIWAGRLVLALILLLPVARTSNLVRTIAAGLLLASLALTGHARLNEGVLGWVHIAVDAAHMVAAGAWLGAIAAFLLLLRPSTPAPPTVRALADFSMVGVAAVLILAATGLANAWLVIGSPPPPFLPLFTTLFGRLLLLKVALFGGMVAMAAGNRFSLVPRLEASASPTVLRRLRAHVLAEQILGLGVLAAVAVLGTLDPSA